MNVDPTTRFEVTDVASGGDDNDISLPSIDPVCRQRQRGRSLQRSDDQHLLRQGIEFIIYVVYSDV